MASLKDLIKLCKRDGGKVFIMGEDGEVELVIMDFDLYQDITQDFEDVTEALEEIKEVLVPAPDPEEVNRQIVDAQLTDAPPIQVAPTSSPQEPIPLQSKETQEREMVPEPRQAMATDSLRLGNVLQERMRGWPKAYTVPTVQTQNGNSEESIDPSFDFEGPKFSIDDI